MADHQIQQFLTEGLGDATYLVAADGGRGSEAALVDPQRDAWRFLAEAERRGWRVTQVLETHVHNDYLSGALEIAASTGAEIVAPARGRYEFRHRPADEGDEVRLGDLRLVARATPGHTPEHLAWELVADPATGPEAVFTGGSLLVGSAGRTDLLGDDETAALTAAQHRSLRRLAAMPDATRVLPTHGSGSFCVAGPADAQRTSTIGDERRRNPLLQSLDAAAFGALLLGEAGRFPAYYARMAPINRAGPALLGRLPSVAHVDPAALAARVASGARLVDARDRDAFAAGHIPGALNVELGDSFAAYVGWLVPFGAPLVLVVPDPIDEAVDEAASGLIRIGYDRIDGVLAGGMAAWSEAGRPIRSYPTTTIAEVGAALADGDALRLLDVRQPVEWRDDGVVPGSLTTFVADLPERLAELADGGEITVMCRSGQRAAIAASLLDAAGIPVRLLARGGAARLTGRTRPDATYPGS